MHVSTCELLGVMVLHRCMVDWVGGLSAMGTCAFFYMCNLLGVMVLHRPMVNWGVIHLPWVYVHSSIGEICWVLWYCIDLWSIGGPSAMGICAFFYM